MKHGFLLIALAMAAHTGWAQKLSPNTEALLLHSEKKAVRSANEKVKAYIKINTPEVVEQIKKLGGHIFMSTEHYLTAELPIAQLRTMAALPGVDKIEAAAAVTPRMKQARELGNANLAHLATNPMGQAYKGEGVVVGIVDNGFEYAHAAYYNADGTNYRVKRIWNQNLTTGNTPAAFNYGTEYKAESEIMSAGFDMQNTYHGGHVAGIAAGGDIASGYYGVAPEADLVLVSNGPTNVDITNAVQYIFDYARSVGKPCVVNLSIGMHYGPHDGTSTSDQLFEEITGEGRIIVGAAGNEGSLPLHLGKTFTETDTQVKTMIGYASESNKQALIDIWGSEGKHFTVKGVVVDLTKGNIVAETEAISSQALGSHYFEYATEDVGADATFTIVSQSTYTDNLCPNIYVETTANYLAPNRKLGLVVTGEDGAEVHMWNSSYGPFISGNKRGWTAGDSRYTVSEVGGTSDAVVTVGSFNSQFAFTALNGQSYEIQDVNPLLDISSFSSQGPTRDGRTKPDVAAPGWCIVSSASKKAIVPSEAIASTEHNGQAYYYEINGGTSMAAPYVTGTLALWLEADPELTPAEMKAIISHAAATDDYTEALSPTPNTAWGYGKIDTYKGLAIAAGHDTGLHQVATEAPRVGYRLDAATLTLTFPQDMGAVAVRLVNAAGATVFHQRLQHTYTGLQKVLPLSALPKGVYVVHIEGALTQQSFKIAR